VGAGGAAAGAAAAAAGTATDGAGKTSTATTAVPAAVHVRDVWQRRELGVFDASQPFGAVVASHGTEVFVVHWG
jgi:hypothetical protein